MRSGTRKSGFTLIEMLVAMAIVVSIVSMVYGSYFATSKSARAYKAKMSASQFAADLLDQMARQIRCAYARAPESAKAGTRETLPKTQGILRKPPDYFRGGPGALTGEILHFVTASSVYPVEDLRYGLIEVVYKLDRTTSALMVSATRFVETAMPLVEERDFTTVMDRVEYIELAFFDGSQWATEWDYSKTKKLPEAVTVSIACKDENGRLCEYAATAQTYCLRKPPSGSNGTFGR